MASAPTLAGTGLVEMFDATRRRTEEIFGFVSEAGFWMRPLPLRHPICFYRGHLAAFAVNTLLKKALGRPGIDSAAETLFERGIDPADEQAAQRASISRWPPREAIERYVAAADAAVREALAEVEAGAGGALAREAAWVCIEHEAMHQETLLYIIRLLPPEEKRPPAGLRPPSEMEPPARHWIEIPAGEAVLGRKRGDGFGWDNEFEETVVAVDGFEIERDDVTNADFLEFVEAGGYRDRRLWTPDDWKWREAHDVTAPEFWGGSAVRRTWKGLFGEVPLPASWPVWVSHAEASAYAAWRGARLPSESEYHRAAEGTSGGNFDFRSWDPVPAGSDRSGVSAAGVRDMVGNGWEWTSTPFAPLPGFRPMPLYPVYSADFFDGRHFVMKGASPVTPAAIVRPSFRNWFQPHYPYVFSSFRCARSVR